MLVLIFYFLLPLGISVLLIPVIKSISIYFDWNDMPGNRKVHKLPVPALGGVAIYCSVLLSLIVLSEFSGSHKDSFLLLGCSIVFLLGIWDDLRNITASKRLIFQAVSALICALSGCLISSAYGVVDIGEIPNVVQWVGTILFFIIIINAFNLIDGINGLCGGLIFCITLSFSILFFKSGNYVWCSIALIVSGGTFGFLIFNFANASIFLGDNGSTLLGMVIAILFLKYINIPIEGRLAESQVAIAFSLFSIPVFDLFRVSVQRVWRGQSPFKADRTHIHHLLLNIFKTHQASTLTILGFQAFIFFITIQLFASLGFIMTLFLSSIIYLLFIELVIISDELTTIKKMEQERRKLNLLN